MKMYSKKDLKFKNGYLIAPDGEIVTPDFNIVGQANQLETSVQRRSFIDKQPEVCFGPNLNEFKRKSIDDVNTCEFKIDTPLLDEKVDESIALMDEIDNAQVVERMNEELHYKYNNLLKFVIDDDIVCKENDIAFSKFDTPTLGNPLEWDVNKIMDAIGYIFGYAEADEDGEQE